MSSRVPLFDVTPRELVRGVITESGMMSPEQAGEIGSRIADLRQRYFDHD